MSNLFRRFLVGLVVLGLVLPLPASAAVPPSYAWNATVGYYTWYLLSAPVYDPDTMQTTYTYQVEGPGPGNSLVQDLSHWTMSICSDVTVVQTGDVVIGPDKTTGIAFGVKWDQAQATTASATYVLVVEGQPATGDVWVAYKAGTERFYGYIRGPVCNGVGPQSRDLFANKFYDRNGNGEWDDDENGIEGWKITLTNSDSIAETKSTDNLGKVGFALDENLTYFVTELYGVAGMPGTGIPGAMWVATLPTTLPDDPVLYPNGYPGNVAREVFFGNRCLVQGQGRTIGYWSNKVGQKDITDTGLSLFGSGGLIAPYNFYSKNSITNLEKLSTYLTGASAGSKKASMYYMLSAQMLATWLNAQTGKIPGWVEVQVGDEWMTLDQIFAEAAPLLVPTTAANQADQTKWKDIFDLINNNQIDLVVPQEQCQVIYPPPSE